jgi:hypothetical protein
VAQVGQVLGERYRLVELLGQGGMATIFRGHDATTPGAFGPVMWIPWGEGLMKHGAEFSLEVHPKIDRKFSVLNTNTKIYGINFDRSEIQMNGQLNVQSAAGTPSPASGYVSSVKSGP